MFLGGVAAAGLRAVVVRLLLWRGGFSLVPTVFSGREAAVVWLGGCRGTKGRVPAHELRGHGHLSAHELPQKDHRLAPRSLDDSDSQTGPGPAERIKRAEKVCLHGRIWKD